MATREEKISAVQKVLGEPVFAELDPKSQKIRTMLFLASVIGIAYVIGGLAIQEGSTFLGLKFDGLDDALFQYFLFGTIFYLGIHFLWSSTDSLLEWRIRVTGTRVAFITAAFWAGDQSDFPNDPRQSSLSNWWQGQAQSIGDIDAKIELVNSQVTAANELIETVGDDQDLHAVVQAVQNVRNEIVDVKGKIESIQKTLEADRIPASLDRYDKWFALFLRSQNLRWLIVEFLLPVLLAGYALLLLGSELFA